MSKKTKHETLASYRNNGDYSFIADDDRKIYHRKECTVLDNESVRRKSLIPLRNVIGKGFKPCPQCAPVPIVSEQKKKEANPLGEQLCTIAKKYGMQAKLIGNSIYITTVADEWFFNYRASPIVLHHKNANQRTDRTGRVLAGDYHRQPNTFDTPFRAISYIRSHTEAAVNRELVPKAAQLRLVVAPGEDMKLFCGEKELLPGCTVTALFPNGWQEIVLNTKISESGLMQWYIATPEFAVYNPIGLFVKEMM